MVIAIMLPCRFGHRRHLFAEVLLFELDGITRNALGLGLERIDFCIAVGDRFFCDACRE